MYALCHLSQELKFSNFIFCVKKEVASYEMSNKKQEAGIIDF